MKESIEKMNTAGQITCKLSEAISEMDRWNLGYIDADFLNQPLIFQDLKILDV